MGFRVYKNFSHSSDDSIRPNPQANFNSSHRMSRDTINFYHIVGNASEPFLKCFECISIQLDYGQQVNFMMHS